MERKFRIGLALLVILLAAAIYVVIIQPGAQEREIRRLLNEANYCTADSDCTVLNTNLGCPFGCYNLGNKNADVTRINVLWDAYRNRSTGSFCEYSCITSPEPQDIKCINNKCVDTRFGN